ncbi:MAG TPA: LEA type 2 family protein [Puia sp.]|nr:LEA type 2 family protein [Puia sp.]
MNPLINKADARSSGTRSPRRIILPVILLLALSCHKPQAPEYYGFQNLQIAQSAGQQTTLATTIKFYNPNNFGLQLKRAEMDVFVNGKLSGHSLLDTTIFIARKDTFYVPVSLQLDLHSLLSNALQLLLNREVKIALDGRVRLKRDGVPFSVPFHYEANQDLNTLLPGN